MLIQIITRIPPHVEVDYVQNLTCPGAGRDSVRITSQKPWTHGLLISDLVHMPGRICGTGPARESKHSHIKSGRLRSHSRYSLRVLLLVAACKDCARVINRRSERNETFQPNLHLVVETDCFCGTEPGIEAFVNLLPDPECNNLCLVNMEKQCGEGCILSLIFSIYTNSVFLFYVMLV